VYKHFFKRLFDVVLSFIGICVLLLPIIIIAIAIKCESKGPVFFKQKRVGIHKKNFMILKFRTMRSDTPHDVPTHEMNNPDKWITKVGRFLRKTSLDEIPQIFNIFIGQMSIIGPRPALWNQFDLIEERDKYGANDVRPGLTGWAQVNGRDALEIPDKARYDGEYVEKLTLFFDFKCFFRTIKFVLKKDGVVEGGTGELNRRKKQQEESELKGVSSAEAVLEEVAVTEEKQAE
jgi:O-antigen biosynthesis protein WbqP